MAIKNQVDRDQIRQTRLMIERKGLSSVDMRGITADSTKARVTFKPHRLGGSMSMQTSRKPQTSKAFASSFVDQQCVTKKVKFRNFFQQKQENCSVDMKQRSVSKQQESRVRDTLNGPMPDYDEEQPNQQDLSNRMLKNEEIREICERLNLTRKEVYEIWSKYISMCLMSDSCAYVLQQKGLLQEKMSSNKDYRVNQSRGGDGKTRIQFSRQNKKSGNGTSQVVSPKSAHSVFDQPETKYDSHVLNESLKTKNSLQGININYFIRNCDFLSLSLPHINKRILIAIGLDIENC